uniref:Uncharacterized protein n=1 Tax=Neogobius melanostomus TaxID=47308 RepID=A0A8C6TKB5_9GOBI
RSEPQRSHFCQFRCSICLEVFSEPVSTPCGHNFCKQCIILHWDTNALCFCPLCNEVFTIRPELRTNTPLSGTVSHPAGLMCPTHQRPLELFCNTDQSCVCTMCVPLKHTKHELWSLEEACECRRSSLQKTLLQNQNMVEQRRLKVQKIRAALDQTQREADRETQQMVKVFSDIMESLQQEMCDVVRALSELETRLSQEFDKVFEQLPKKDQLRRVQQFLVDVTLDPDTAHPNLILSEDLKQVHHTDVKNKHPNTSQRFTKCCNVLGKQSFSSGRFYFEVQFVNKKEEISLSPKNGYWTMALRNRDQYIALANSPVILSLWRPPQKVGVFVDYGAGLVSFYDVDSADLIYSFTGCRFKWRLLPFFGPWLNNGGRNSAPLTITAVQTE